MTIVFAVIAVFFALVGVYNISKTRKLLKEGVRTVGVIDSYDQIEKITVRNFSFRSNTVFRALIKYQDAFGENRYLKSHIRSNKKGNEIGDEVRVIYLDDSSMVLIDNPVAIFGAIFSSFFFALVFIMLAYLF